MHSKAIYSLTFVLRHTPCTPAETEDWRKGVALRELSFKTGEPDCRVEVHLRLVLNGPAATGEDGVDLLAGLFLGCHTKVDLPQQA